MKVAVVGGGITGCLAALHARKLGAEVTLYESANALGGILRDIEADGQRFFNGCQYLEDDLCGIDDPALRPQLHQFSHEYGSFTRLPGHTVRTVDDCAQPVLDGPAELHRVADIHGSAAQRLRAYGRAGDVISQWASGFGQLDVLDWRCLVPMQVSRVYFPDDPEAQQSKLTDPLADQLLAIPRRQRSPGAAVESAMLPSLGYTAFFDAIEGLMLESGIHVRLSSPVKIRMSSGRPELYVRQSIQSFDKLVWASNPTPLMSAVGGMRLQTPAIPMQLVMGCFQTPVFSKPYYWQVFDKESPVVRVYLYVLGGRHCFSVEAFSQPVDDWYDILAPLFEQLGLGSAFYVSHSEQQKRFVNFSSDEYELIESLSSQLPAMNVIPGGWNRYGRRQKMSVIRTHLDELAR